ncbi:MAG: 2-oxoglutarate dehydrogenase E1 component [Chloroflexota bacterium]
MKMQSPTLQADQLEGFLGPNAGYVLEQYERYLRDPDSVPAAMRAWFRTWSAPRPTATELPPPALSAVTVDQIVGASNLARAIRAYGHLAARLDPLGTAPPGDPSLELATYDLSENDLRRLPASVVGGPPAASAPNAAVAMATLRRIYCGTTGYEFRHVQSAGERVWLQHVVETQRFQDPNEPIDARAILQQLTNVEAFEHFVHRAFPGQKRFSIEGLDALVPMLLELIGCAAERGTQSLWLGMAHRGRLAVLTEVLGKPVTDIFAELRHAGAAESVPPSERSGSGWTGDVTYHLGARTAYQDGRPVGMLVTLAPNPSHLEYVNPVVEGMCRASDERRNQPGSPTQDVDRALPCILHGDAAFAAEGIVAETLNLSRLTGYTTGGTINLITNNQLGFTTPPSSARSTMYASDLAKGYEIPIVHVNADDPAACIAAIRLAHTYRDRFHKDFLIDLIGYRRWGHNEADEPSYTQPLLYREIQSHPAVRTLWAERLAKNGDVPPAEAEGMLREATERLQELFQKPDPPSAPPTVNAETSNGVAAIVTAVPAERLKRLNAELLSVPPGFTVNPKLVRWMERRRAAVEPEGAIDWAQAEALALASLLVDGTPVRLTGQDTARGTFSQRHLVLHDSTTGATFTPLQALADARASFEIHDSPLEEAAPLGFEYGYGTQAPDALVVWESQFGDFANAAQVIIDQFVVAGQAKWGQTSSLVMLLPHALEGQGPEHSSARIERFLQMAAENNLRIANCTTAGQYFHLLRHQAAFLWRNPRPLIVFTPKSLLRHGLAASTLSDLATGQFQTVLDDLASRARAAEITRLILCSGHVYVDLAASPLRGEHPETAIARVEQLYPFPFDALREVVEGYPRRREVIWVQEEPLNMGAWTFAEPRIARVLPGDVPLRYVGRPRRASPAVGAHDLYAVEQEQIIAAAYGSLGATSAPLVVEVSHGK